MKKTHKKEEIKVWKQLGRLQRRVLVNRGKYKSSQTKSQ